MPDVVLVLVLVAAACVPLWLLRGLRVLPAPGRDAGRTVSVVVPARNEEQTLPTLLGSLLTSPGGSTN